MSDTPRTDEVDVSLFGKLYADRYMHLRDFARQLERELTQREYAIKEMIEERDALVSLLARADADFQFFIFETLRPVPDVDK